MAASALLQRYHQRQPDASPHPIPSVASHGSARLRQPSPLPPVDTVSTSGSPTNAHPPNRHPARVAAHADFEGWALTRAIWWTERTIREKTYDPMVEPGGPGRARPCATRLPSSPSPSRRHPHVRGAPLARTRHATLRYRPLRLDYILGWNCRGFRGDAGGVTTFLLHPWPQPEIIGSLPL